MSHPPSVTASVRTVAVQEQTVWKERTEQVAQAVLLTMLYAVPALIAVHAAVVGDPDIWWHLRTGEWIFQHRAVPHVDPFSSFGAGKPWAAYSWLFELLVFGLFHRFGAVGIVVYTGGMLVGITIAVHHLVRRQLHDFSAAVLLTFAVCFSCGRLYTPRPWLFTILFFAVEVDILMQARRTGRMRELCWLPVVFLLWANIHIQFVNGLMVLGLATAEACCNAWWMAMPTRLRTRPLLIVVAASVVATLCNPYGWHVYRVAYDLAAQPGVLDKLQELQAIPFRSLCDWCVLVFALGATAVLARARQLALFEIAFLALACLLAFRSQRDVWMLAVAAAAILSPRIAGPRMVPTRVPPSFTPVLAVMAAGVVAVGFRCMSVSNSSLGVQLASKLPVRAVQFVKAQGYAGSVYNDYAWGGYLIWALREPVSLDGRAALHGDERIDRSVATWGGQPAWDHDPELRSARLVVGATKTPLVQLLRLVPAFRLVYEDQTAAVFVRR